MGDLDGFAEHRLSGTVLGLGELDGALDGSLVDLFACDDVCHVHLCEYAWMFRRAFCVDANLESGHLLAFLLQDGDGVHRRAPRQTDGHQFQWSKAIVFPTQRRVGTQWHFKTRGGGTSEGQSLMPRYSCFHI